ncbi:ketol-acid reductoisomerase [Lipomyces orientalis]|uniref:Ketol-acid reductoisomerase n=1 Tax=Lipomyces orientalis TaxID=1233043 RepID=A0ACC3TGG9_9ASCO
MAPANIFYDDDADISLVKGKTILFIGYGNQGRAQALNFRDTLKYAKTDATILIANLKDSYAARAHEDGFEVTQDWAKATALADVIFLLIPDQVQPKLFNSKIGPSMKPGATVVVASGYNVFYKLLDVPKGANVVMAAPRMIGTSVRSRFVSNAGYPCFVSVEQDATGNAHELALAISRGIGATKAGAIESSAREETLIDLFAEQALWPTVINAFTEAYKLLRANGCSDEALVHELYYSMEPAEIFEKCAEDGFVKQLVYHSKVSQFGQLNGALSLDGSEFVSRFQKVLKHQIIEGEFMRNFSKMEKAGTLDKELESLFERAGKTELALGEKLVFERLGHSYGAATGKVNGGH